ncbi:MAG TPA: hypothetical protein VIJ68_00820 [Candidatus Saccharimonadales bacterium]
MDLYPTVLVFAMGTSFKGYVLTERYLQERGVAPIRTFGLQRYALIPGLIWCAFFVHGHDLSRIVHTPHLLLYVIALAVGWNIQQFLSSYTVNTISSMSAFSTLQMMLLLPLSLLVGTFFNHDIPSAYSFLAIIVLLVAFVVHPTQHVDNIRERFALPLRLIVGLILIQTIIDAADQGLYRQLLKELGPAVVLGIFSVVTLGVAALWTSFVPKKQKETEVLRKQWRRSTALPALWFLGSIPEAYAVAILPIYTSLAISSVTFLMDAFSDLIHHRVRLNPRTVAFLALVLVGIGLAVYSIK